MNKKAFYEAPEAEILNVRFEENILSGDGTWDNSIKQGTSWNDDDPAGGYGLE